MALAAIAVPLLIHLINLRRPEKIRFSTLQFFEALRRTTVRRIRIKEYLLLLLRLLAIASLALVLARPFLPSTLFGDSRSVTYILVIDNSPSMLQQGENGTWFMQARESAQMFITASEPASRFVVVPTHGPWTLPQPGGAAEALRLLGKIEPSEGAFRLPLHLEAVSQQVQAGTNPVVCFLFSDMQAGPLKAFAEAWVTKLLFPLYAVKTAGESAPNTALTGLSVTSRILSERRPVQFKATVTHFGKTPLVNAFVSLEVNGNVAGQYPLALEPGASRDYVFEWIPPDGKPAVITAVIEGDSWSFDNKRFIALDMPQRKDVLVVGERQQAGQEAFYNRMLNAASRMNRTLDIKQVTPDALTPELIGSATVIVLNGIRNPRDIPADLVRDHVQSGRSLLFIPGNQADQNAWNSFLKSVNAGEFQGFEGEFGKFEPVSKMKRPSADLPLLQDVFDIKQGQKLEIQMPSIFYQWLFQPIGSPFLLLQTEEGKPLITEHRSGLGTTVVSSIGTEPGWSDFPAQVIYPVFWYRLLQSLAHREQLAARETIVGKPFQGVFAFDEAEVTIQGKSLNVKPLVTRTATGVKVEYDGLDWLPGVYRIVSGSKSVGLAVNPDILESDFQTLEQAETERMLETVFASVHFFNAGTSTAEQQKTWMASAGRGQEIWKWFLVLGMLFLGAETVLQRTFKTGGEQ